MIPCPSIAILGAGRWGTAVASLLADNGHDVILWCHEPEVAYDIKHDHINRLYCPDFVLHKNISATTSLKEALQDTNWIFEAIPVKFLGNLVQQAKPYISTNATWIVLSKGIEAESLKLPTQIIQSIMDDSIKAAVFGGPTFAHELMHKQFSSASIASTDTTVCNELAQLLNNNYFISQISSDPIGVQVGGAVKNVIALMTGMVNGAGFKDNTTAYLLTRALEEMATLVFAMGGQRETVYGLSGLGDMILTCTGSLSKNLKAGRLIAHGRTMEELTREFGTLPEGINTVESVMKLMQHYNVSLPLCKATYDIMFNGAQVENLFH